MKLDPKKPRVGKLSASLKKLGEIWSKGRPKGARDWASETARTLEAGKLEDFDLTEFVVAAYEADLAGPEDVPVDRPYAEALAELIELMIAAGVRAGDRLLSVQVAVARRLKAAS